MATNTAPLVPPARHNAANVVQFLRYDFDYTLADQTTLTIGTIPAGSLIYKTLSGVQVSTVFNAGTNNYVDIGASTDSGTNNFATQLSLLALGLIAFDEAVSYYVADETKIQALVHLSGTAATTGVGQIVVAYVDNNDN